MKDKNLNLKRYNGIFEKDHPAWRPNACIPNTLRARARRKVKLDLCEICGAKAIDRHHKDGDIKNNQLLNLQSLCRKCHMTVDGRIERSRLRSTLQLAKLSGHQVIDILNLKGSCTSAYLGGLYGVHPATINRIWRGATWKRLR